LYSRKRPDGDGGHVEYWLRRDTETGRTVSLTRIHVRADGSTETTIILKDERDGSVELVTHEVEDEEGTDTTRDRPGEESTYEHVERDGNDEDSSNDYPAPEEARGEPDDAREQRQRTRRLILSGEAFGQPNPDGSGAPSNSSGWWGLIFGLRPPGYDSSPGMGPPDATTQPVQDGAQAAVTRRNLWAMLPWFVNPNPAGNAGNDDANSARAESQDAIEGEQAQQTENAARDAGMAGTDDDPFAGFSPEDLAELDRNAGGSVDGLVLLPSGGINTDTPGGGGGGGGPKPPFSAMAGPGNSFGSFGSILSRGVFGGANGPISPNPNPNGVK
jgi:hypothetical protein